MIKRTLVLLGLALFIGITPITQAREPHTVNKQDAAVAAMERIPGKVISVNQEYRGPTPVYRIKVLDEQGGLHTVIVHGQTSAILSAH